MRALRAPKSEASSHLVTLEMPAQLTSKRFYTHWAHVTRDVIKRPLECRRIIAQLVLKNASLSFDFLFKNTKREPESSRADPLPVRLFRWSNNVPGSDFFSKARCLFILLLASLGRQIRVGAFMPISRPVRIRLLSESTRI